MTSLLITVISHILPMVLLIVGFGMISILFYGTPYLKYLNLVSQADTNEGQEDFAKYLAKKTGGRKIDVNQSWKSFLPAAKDIHKIHIDRRNNLNNETPQ